MAVTKRTRFEILRRDGHACQYCGAKAPDVALQVDHVVPVSLGGDDNPGNLVAACADCNRGKASIQPDSPLVEGLTERAASYAFGMQDKMTRFRADFDRAGDYIEEFNELWGAWEIAGRPDGAVPLPPDYELALFRWCQMGVPVRAIELAIPKAMSMTRLRGEFGVFQYMAGIVWRMFDEREIDTTVSEDSAAVYTEFEKDELLADAFEAGERRGWSKLYSSLRVSGRLPRQDLVQAQIDNLTSDHIKDFEEGGTPPWRVTERTSTLTSGTTTISDP